MFNHRHILALRRLRENLGGEEKAALRYVLNRLETLETKLKTINRLSNPKREHTEREIED
jgi:hypothetical protein